MRQRRFGSLEVDVPIVGLGTWNMERDDGAAAVAALRRGIELGLTHVDTAEMYGSGVCEELVAQAIAGQRDKVFLVSKVLPRNASHAGTLAACERSLKRLGTDRLDCYLLHWRGNEPLAETFGAFEALRAQGKIRSWGVSNFDDADLAESLALVGPGVIACNQVLYHLGERSIEHRVIPVCAKHDIAVVAYSPFGSGRFPKSAVLDELARRLAATPRQVALAFLARRTFAIPKSSSAEHVAELAHEIELDDAAVAAIEAAFPLAPWRGLPSI
jgi:diketogulonate reductase-like aldo/keto reductase